MRLGKTPKLQKAQPSKELNQANQHIKIVSICFKNVFEAILKRLEGQAFSKMIANSARHNQKKSTIKFISYFSTSFLKRKKQTCFNKLKKLQHLSLIKNKAAISLAFYCRRTINNDLKLVWNRLKFLKLELKSNIRRRYSRKSAGEIPSPRMSQQSQKSNILAISQDSLSEKHDIQFEHRRDYAQSFDKNIFAQIQQLKKMELSQGFRGILHNMQGFSQFADIQALFRELNDPIIEELRRLQQVRAEENLPKHELYDNQLTLTFIFNQIKFWQQQSIKEQQPLQIQMKSSQFLSSQELTTLKIITSVLRERQYKDIKREIDFFIKKTSRKQFVPLLRQVLAAFQHFSGLEEADKSKDKDKQELSNIVSLLDKHLRAEKYDEVQKLKNKVKNSAVYYELTALMQTLISMANEIKKYKKKQSAQVSRMLKSPAKQQSSQEQNESLKQQLKSLQIKLRQLEGENQKMKDTMKKNVDRVHPSLLPKKTAQKEVSINVNGGKNQDFLKKYKQLQATMQKRLESLSKETAGKLQKAKQDQRRLQEKIKQLSFQLQNSQNHTKNIALKIKQKQDFLQMYQNITKKLFQKEPFLRDINEFKKKHAQSKFIQIIERIANQQNSRNTLLNQLKNILTAFDDNSWKRKQNNLLFKNQGELYAIINILIDRHLNFLRQRQEGKSLQKQLEIIKKNQEKLVAENIALKEQALGFKKQIKQARDQLVKLNSQKATKTQSVQSNSKTKSPEKIYRSSVDKQIANLRAQNFKLKAQLQNNLKAASQEQSTSKIEVYKKQLEQGAKAYELIKAKKSRGQPFAIHINQFKRACPKSYFIQIFEAMSKDEIEKLQLVNQLKNVASCFADGSWKKRQNNLQLKQQDDLHLQINHLIQMLLHLSKMADQSKYIALATQLKNIKVMFQDNSWKRRQNALVLKEQSQLHTTCNQLVSFTISQLNQKERFVKTQGYIEQLKNKVAQLEAEVANLSSAKNREKNQEKNRQFISLKNQKLQMDKEITKNLTQIQQLKIELQETSAKRSQLEIRLNSHEANRKQLQSLIKLYQIIKSKKMLGQSSIKQVNEYKKNYSNSLSLEIVEAINSNITEEYNKATKEIPQRKNAQMLSAQQRQKQERKDLQMEKLREENTRLKSEFKTRPESPETKEKLNIERQKTLNQMREINELKLQIDKFKLQNNRYRDQLQNALKTNALANSQLDRIHSELQSARKEIASKRDQQYSHLTQALHNKLEQFEHFKLDWEKRQTNYMFQLKQAQQKNQTLEKSLQQSEVFQSQFEQNIEEYKVLYQKMKQERNNLVLLLQQKNQECQMTKENEELIYRQRDQKQDKIKQLRHKFEQTEVDIKQIQSQLSEVLAQKATLLSQCAQDLQRSQSQIIQLKSTLDLKQKIIADLQAKTQLDMANLRNMVIVKQNEKGFLQRQLDLQNQQTQFLKQRSNGQILELRLKCQQLTRQLQNLQNQKDSFSPLVAENSKIINHFPEDHEKLELRKQLELVNQQMANFVRNSQSQKRQMRQYMQKLSNQMQMQNILHNQQKKMLREDIQRAKNQQYQISQDKLSRLRADIQGLRMENQRLIAIIDHNEQAFQQLIEEHREMVVKIEHLQEFNQSLSSQNTQLISDIFKAEQERLELALKLQPLEEKLVQLQNQIALALEQKKQTEKEMLRSSQTKQNSLQNTINKLTHQNRILQANMASQAKSLLDLHQNNLRLQSQISHHKQMANQELYSQQSGDYSNYLEQKVNEQNQSIKRLVGNQSKLVQKIQQLMSNICQLQKERVQLHSQKRQRDFQLSKNKDPKSTESLWYEKYIHLQRVLAQYQRQKSYWKPLNPQPSSQIQQSQAKIKQLQQLANLYSNETSKLKRAVQQKSKENIVIQQKADLNLKLNIQIKHLSSKIKTMNQDIGQLQLKCSRYQSEIIHLRRQKTILLQNHSSDSRLQHLKQSLIIKQKQQEISWLKSQIINKDNQLHKIRIAQLDLSNKVKAYHQKLAQYQHLQILYSAELKSHQQTKRQIHEIQISHQNELKTIRDYQRSALDIQEKLNLKIEVLQRQNQALLIENRQLLSGKQAKTIYNFALRELVLQLDDQFNFQASDEQLQIRILQKISQQISQLLMENNKLKLKCTQIQNNIYANAYCEETKQQFVYLLQKLTQDILSYLKHQQLINPEDLNLNLKYLLHQPTNNSEIYLQNLSLFIKNVINSINKDSLQLLMLYSTKLDKIKDRFELHTQNNNLQSFNRLKGAIYANLQQ